jgi:hypothetical protein
MAHLKKLEWDGIGGRVRRQTSPHLYGEAAVEKISPRMLVKIRQI